MSSCQKNYVSFKFLPPKFGSQPIVCRLLFQTTKNNLSKVTLLCISDINECTLNIHNCDSNATCTNFNGGFNCNCNIGYSGNGTFCEGKPRDRNYVLVKIETRFGLRNHVELRQSLMQNHFLRNFNKL